MEVVICSLFDSLGQMTQLKAYGFLGSADNFFDSCLIVIWPPGWDPDVQRWRVIVMVRRTIRLARTFFVNFPTIGCRCHFLQSFSDNWFSDLLSNILRCRPCYSCVTAPALQALQFLCSVCCFFQTAVCPARANMWPITNNVSVILGSMASEWSRCDGMQHG